MSEFLTVDQIFALDDIEVKEVIIPADHGPWSGKKFRIKQLTRGQQDNYLKRQFGGAVMKAAKGKDQEFNSLSPYGHDAWLCVKGLVDENGQALFKEEHIPKLLEKNGKPIGWLASQIVEFSGMAEDIKVARGDITEEQKVAEDLKNLKPTPTD